jgi:hypothetical protein
MRCKRRIRHNALISRRHACSATVCSSGLSKHEEAALAGDGDRAPATIDDTFVNSNGYSPQ